jgi:DNA polymerase I
LKTILLIDGDVLVYQIGLACERETDWGDDIWTLHSDFGDARSAFESRIDSLKEKLKADDIRIALSCPTDAGFRRQLVPTYKSNRTNRKPLVHAPLREHLLNDWGAVLKPRLEADDVIGMWATEKTTERRIVVSVDKDFAGVPCEFYKLKNHGEHEHRVVTKPEADRWHALQTLMGDAVDGYAGIKGVGIKTAEKILAGVEGDYWPTIKNAYEEAGLSEELALSNARLARILRHGEYNDTTNKIRLWTPPARSKQKTDTAISTPKK